MADEDKKPESTSDAVPKVSRDQITIDRPKQTEILNLEHQEISDWYEKVRFRRKLLGGISEEDVWKKLEELNGMFEAALRAERIRYDALLEQQKEAGDRSRGDKDPKKGSWAL